LVLTQSKETVFLIKFGGFYNKSKILTILFIVKCKKITLLDEFLVLLRPIISRFFACSNEEKNKQKQQRVLALVLSLWFHVSTVSVGNYAIFPNFFQLHTARVNATLARFFVTETSIEEIFSFLVFFKTFFCETNLSSF
jgi:hypothetical protein